MMMEVRLTSFQSSDNIMVMNTLYYKETINYFFSALILIKALV